MKRSFLKRMPLLLASCLFLGLSFSASAQAISGDSIKAQFVKDWERAKSYTMEYLNAMPADKYSFKAVDSIRSFAQQMLHLAFDNVNLITVATGEKMQFPGRNLENSPTAQTKDSVVSYVTQSYDFAIASVKKLDPNKYGEITGFGKLQVSRFAWLLKAFEHQTHHRGQTTIYIRLQGIRPPNERLF
ncbi:MAG TPA: DinB family protein [Puia sp.]|nr:DinB family protein [Puia sp.]